MFRKLPEGYARCYRCQEGRLDSYWLCATFQRIAVPPSGNAGWIAVALGYWLCWARHLPEIILNVALSAEDVHDLDPFAHISEEDHISLMR